MMLTTALHSRAAGDTAPAAFEQSYTSRLLHALQPAPHVEYHGPSAASTSIKSSIPAVRAPAGPPDTVGGASSSSSNTTPSRTQKDTAVAPRVRRACAHPVGVNALAVDKFEGRFVVSGGADGRILMWDLEAASFPTTAADRMDNGRVVHRSVGSVNKPSSTFGVTGLSFYPFDSLAFLASSYDHTLRLYDSTTLQASASFELASVVYAHAISPIASHLLVACATQHPAVRLVDLRSGAATHSLAGHGGAAILSVAWSPKDENILASGASDGTVRLWDIRRSAASLGVLDLEDSVGWAGQTSGDTAASASKREQGHAHHGPVNGMLWTEGGEHLVTAGHDERIRVWDTITCANTLANFGPMVRNANLATILPVLVPRVFVPTLGDILFYPNEREILMYELFEGRLVKRLRPVDAPATKAGQAEQKGQRNLRNQVTALAWRAHNIELLSAHSDGLIRTWLPRTQIDAFVDEVEEEEDTPADPASTESRKRKRQTLDEIHRNLTTAPVTFT